ncbi:MAG: hypothetical protein PHX59_00360 [Sulfuricurvum sp.]|nr:hypothetical protein [Sulfuricurvum sp.]
MFKKVLILALIVTVGFAKPIDLECKITYPENMAYQFYITVNEETKSALYHMLDRSIKMEPIFNKSTIVLRDNEPSIKGPIEGKRNITINRATLEISNVVEQTSYYETPPTKSTYISKGHCSITKLKNKI